MFWGPLMILILFNGLILKHFGSTQVVQCHQPTHQLWSHQQRTLHSGLKYLLVRLVFTWEDWITSVRRPGDLKSDHLVGRMPFDLTKYEEKSTKYRQYLIKRLNWPNKFLVFLWCWVFRTLVERCCVFHGQEWTARIIWLINQRAKHLFCAWSRWCINSLCGWTNAERRNTN